MVQLNCWHSFQRMACSVFTSPWSHLSSRYSALVFLVLIRDKVRWYRHKQNARIPYGNDILVSLPAVFHHYGIPTGCSLHYRQKFEDNLNGYIGVRVILTPGSSKYRSLTSTKEMTSFPAALAPPPNPADNSPEEYSNPYRLNCHARPPLPTNLRRPTPALCFPLMRSGRVKLGEGMH